jgi:hypothetical protein
VANAELTVSCGLFRRPLWPKEAKLLNKVRRSNDFFIVEFFNQAAKIKPI